MKHFHFVQSLEPLQGGGLGRAAADLHETFLDLGETSRLISTAGSNAAPAHVPYARVLPRFGPGKAFFSTDLVPVGIRGVQDADTVHGHGFYVAPNWVVGRAARRFGKPLVLHPHGMFEPWILRRSRIKKRIAHLLFENANFRAARLWRALTNKEADQIRAQGIGAPIVVAPNGVDPAPFDKMIGVPESPDRKKTVLFLGRLHPKKGVDLLIEAWASVKRGLRDGWSLVVAGPDEGGYLAGLQDSVQRHGLEGSVRFPGLVTGDEKIRLLRSSDVFVLPSHSEGFSVAILEAMAARLPVIATPACNFPDLIAEGGSWECEPETASITEALQRAIGSDPAERSQRGEAGRKLLEARYTWKSAAKTLLDACEQYCR